jgi:hypothetical protein
MFMVGTAASNTARRAICYFSEPASCSPGAFAIRSCFLSSIF